MMIQIKVNTPQLYLMTGVIYHMFWVSGFMKAKRKYFGAKPRTIQGNWLAKDIQLSYDKKFIENY